LVGLFGVEDMVIFLFSLFESLILLVPQHLTPYIYTIMRMQLFICCIATKQIQAHSSPKPSILLWILMKVLYALATNT
jgi:hypothetical protein